jgi:adenosylcobinamide-phosphate synthase
MFLKNLQKVLMQQEEMIDRKYWYRVCLQADWEVCMIDLIIAVIIDLLIGDPYSFPHPIKLMGKIIAVQDKLARKVCNTNKQLLLGGLVIVVVNTILALTIPYLVLKALKPYNILYHVVNVYLLYTCIAARCLHDEAIKIYRAFSRGLEEARYRLSFIVGRETKDLKEHEIIRATVETVAENTSDGVIAPLFFGVLGGAPLAMVYKMVNTMDSILGYTNEKYRHMGFFPAKTDDIFNFIPARLTGLLMNFSSILRFDFVRGVKVMIRDRKNHKSPNCAYPEGAVAGLLGVQLGGDNVYFGEIIKKPKIGDKIRDLTKEDIKSTIEIMYRAETAFVIIALIYGVIL